MNLNPRQSENPLPLSVNQLRPIPDLNEPPEDQGANANGSDPAAGIEGFVPSTLHKKELFLRQALEYLRHSSYPASHKVTELGTEAYSLLGSLGGARGVWEAVIP
jgi:hypothetical protein